MIHGFMRLTITGILFCSLTVPVMAQVDTSKLMEQLNSKNEQERLEAIDAVTKLGPEAPVQLVPTLARFLTVGTTEERWRAARAIAAIGPAAANDAVSALVECLRHKDPMVRAYCAHALGKMGKTARSAENVVAELVRLAVDKNRLVRREAREALLAIEAPPEVTLPLLVKVLEESEPEALLPALETLAEQGKKVVPRLMEVLESEKGCYWACLVIERIGPDAAEAVPQLMHCVKRDAPEVRIEALLALASIGEAARPAVETVASVLENDPFTGVKYAAAYALGRLGDSKAIPALEKAAESDDPILKLTALWSLVRLKPNDRELMERAVQAFAEGLQSDNEQLRSVAATAFAETDIPVDIAEGPLLKSLVDKLDQATIDRLVDAFVKRGKAAVPRIVRALDDPKHLPHAVQILNRIGPDAAEAVPKLVELLDKVEDPSIRRDIIVALGSIGPASAPALPKLLKLLKTADTETKYALTYAIGQLGPKAEAANPQLLELVESKDRFLRVSALWALLKINPGHEEIAKFSVPYLISALSDSRPGVRAEMARMLGDLGDLAKSAIPALKQLAQSDPDAMVRDAATEALRKLQDPAGVQEHDHNEKAGK